MPRGKSTNLSVLSSATLRRELARRTQLVSQLQRQHRALMIKAARLQEKIELLGGTASSDPRTTGTRPRNEAPLEEFLVRVLTGKKLSVTQAVDAVQKAGYRSSSANLRTIVNQRLIASPKFKKVERGIYTAK